jgi:hypothetical protein
MTDQIGTPGSNADSSINAGKAGAPKDKVCPFCHQAFTSSSLGRHLDLYIKEKNPKPADGLHNVDEIRKMRGGITRRQPRSSMSRREGSTPTGTPGTSTVGTAHGKRSPASDADGGNAGQDLRSPRIRRLPGDTSRDTKGATMHLNNATWHTTGVMNDIPSITRNGDSGRWEAEGDTDRLRRGGDGRRSVSRQILAKSTFDQKQKMLEALDSARAAELALKEVLGSVRAAK